MLQYYLDWQVVLSAHAGKIYCKQKSQQKLCDVLIREVNEHTTPTFFPGVTAHIGQLLSEEADTEAEKGTRVDEPLSPER